MVKYMKTKIGLQIYSIREKCDQDFENVLKQVAAAGYDGIEFYSFFNIEADKMKQLLNTYNLKAMGTHTNFDVLQNDLDGLIRYMTTIESQYVGLAGYACEDRDGWLKFCEKFDKVGEKLRQNGISLLYHNHAHEFEQKFDGETVQEIILKNTSPENVSLEVDCYWVRYADLDPETYLKNNINRIKTIHLKDMSTDDRKMTEVGTGINNCSKLFNIVKDAGFEWVVIEQDNIYIDQFESIKISIDNVKKF